MSAPGRDGFPRKACRAQVRSCSECRHPLDISSTPRAYPAAMHFSRERIRARLHLLQESLPAALARRFFETDLLTHAAALSFYALLSLAPLLVLLLWLAASLYPSAQDELIRQVGDLAGSGARDVATTVVANAQRRPDVGPFAGLYSTVLLFIGPPPVFARLATPPTPPFHHA